MGVGSPRIYLLMGLMTGQCSEGPPSMETAAPEPEPETDPELIGGNQPHRQDNPVHAIHEEIMIEPLDPSLAAPPGPPALQPKPRPKRPTWVHATGTRVTRIKKARAYLRKRAWVPGQAHERHTALFIVMGNLRLYHQLPINLALSMVMEHFNPRCLDAPFTDGEIRTEYRRAGLPGMYPTLGVSDPRAIKKEARLELQKEIRRFSRRHLAPGGSCTPASVLEAFIAFRGGVPISNVVFGRAFAVVTGIRRKTPFGVPTYPDVHLVEPVSVRRKAA